MSRPRHPDWGVERDTYERNRQPYYISPPRQPTRWYLEQGRPHLPLAPRLHLAFETGKQFPSRGILVRPKSRREISKKGTYGRPVDFCRVSITKVGKGWIGSTTKNKRHKARNNPQNVAPQRQAIPAPHMHYAPSADHDTRNPGHHVRSTKNINHTSTNTKIGV